MSADVAIRAEGLGKSYRIPASGSGVRYKTLRDDLMRLVGRGGAGAWTTIWALRDVSFEVARGEVLGVIGRNGAGKSTLLKILARITDPTLGRGEVHGRVGSLLEVGTGFHPELSGRENVFLAGTILGMRRAEVQRRFDEIVAFAEVEEFIDAPVKRYSSGMYMRLAFAVAAHLDPEVLLVDEVLAVGDAAFRKKCLDKMQDVAGRDRTVLFVSHSMAAIENLCDRVLVLSGGKVDFLGPTAEAIRRYMASEELGTGIVDLTRHTDRHGSGELRLLRFWLEDAGGKPAASVRSGDACALVCEFEAPDGKPRKAATMSIHINTITGAILSLINTTQLNANFEAAPRGLVRLRIPKLPLSPGRYIIDINLGIDAGHTYADFCHNAAAMDVEEGDFYGTGVLASAGAPILIDGRWEVEALSATPPPP